MHGVTQRLGMRALLLHGVGGRIERVASAVIFPLDRPHPCDLLVGVKMALLPLCQPSLQRGCGLSCQIEVLEDSEPRDARPDDYDHLHFEREAQARGWRGSPCCAVFVRQSFQSWRGEAPARRQIGASRSRRKALRRSSAGRCRHGCRGDVRRADNLACRSKILSRPPRPGSLRPAPLVPSAPTPGSW